MSDVQLWLVLLGMGVITFLLRLSLLGLSERWRLPPLLEHALRFVPPAVLSALVTPALFYRQGMLDLSLGNDRLLAGALAAFIAWRTKNILLTIASGMAALWLLRTW